MRNHRQRAPGRLYRGNTGVRVMSAEPMPTVARADTIKLSLARTEQNLKEIAKFAKEGTHGAKSRLKEEQSVARKIQRAQLKAIAG